MQKWVALAVIGIGATLMIAGFRADATASFESGTFIGELAGILGGGGLIIIGVIWLAVLVFLNL